MNEAISFKIQSLLSHKDGGVSGPMSPVLLAKELAKSTRFKFNRLARVSFDDERINQKYEDGGLTGYDNLIIATVYSNDLWLSLWVDYGVGGMPVAMSYLSGREIEITPIYKAAKYARKLTEVDVAQIFQTIFLNPALLNIINE